ECDAQPSGRPGPVCKRCLSGKVSYHWRIFCLSFTFYNRAAAFIALFKYKVGIVPLIGACAAAELAYSLLQ
ncbi:MAG: hypothetical protein KAU29_02240, partial [Gammaproteobacteria bacterium]|nr:hypothetical protein [Gammaproteobacteria bacterium]